MDKLPDLILIKILNNLTINNQINLRLLNKRWKSTIDDNLSNCKKELIFFFKLLPRPEIWQYNQKRINFKNSIVFNEKIRDWNYFKNLFCKNIERFCIFFYGQYYISSNIDWTSILNEFINLCSNLVHLELKNYCLKEININLPNLKTLFVESNKIDTVNLNCPNLEKLSINHDFEMSEKFNQIRKSLKFLKVQSFTYLPHYNLPNLEVIYICHKMTIDISHFEKLKEIHFFCSQYRLREDQIINLLKSFLDQKTIHNRECLEIFYDGIKFQSDTIDFIKSVSLEFSSPIEISEETIKLYLDNQLKMDYLNKGIQFSGELLKDIYKMNYNQIDNLSKYITYVRFIKNPNFENKLIDYEFKLINLLKNVKQLSISPFILKLNEYKLNKIPGLFTNLIHISFNINNLYDFQFSHFYFRFLINFKGLKMVRLFDHMISVEELGIIIEELKQLDFINITRVNFNRVRPYGQGPGRDNLRIEIISNYENEFKINFSSDKDKNLKIFDTKNEFFIYLKEKEKIKAKFYDNFLENDYNINEYNICVNSISIEEYFYLQEH